MTKAKEWIRYSITFSWLIGSLMAWITVSNNEKLTNARIKSNIQSWRRAGHGSSSLFMNNNIQSISLDSMSENHEQEGTLIATSVAKWLDTEWMPQDIHVQMGLSAKRSYITCRQQGDAEVMSIMMKIAGDLEENWKLYDKDAFVNAWDVANYVSDYLTFKSSSEGCECSSRIY